MFRALPRCRRTLLVAWLAAGCTAEGEPEAVCQNVCDTGVLRAWDTSVPFDERDKDCDGFTEAEGDCNDNNCFVYPGAPREYNNGLDDDCDGEADLWYGCGQTSDGVAGALGLFLLAGIRRRRVDGAGGSGPGSVTMDGERAPWSS